VLATAAAVELPPPAAAAAAAVGFCLTLILDTMLAAAVLPNMPANTLFAFFAAFLILLLPFFDELFVDCCTPALLPLLGSAFSSAHSESTFCLRCPVRP
jgi:hypothetical protein